MRFFSLSSLTLSFLAFFVSQTSASTNSLLVGQRVIFSYPGVTVPQQLLDAITAGNCRRVHIHEEGPQKSSFVRPFRWRRQYLWFSFSYSRISPFFLIIFGDCNLWDDFLHLSWNTRSGVIFFGDNIKNANLSQSIAQLNLANSKGPHPDQPLLLMTDQEGGQVRRLPGGPVNVSFAKEEGKRSAKFARTFSAWLCFSVDLSFSLFSVK